MAKRNQTDQTEPETAAGGTAAAATDEQDQADSPYAFPIPAEFAGKPGVDLLMEACTLYNINPDAGAVPVHLLAWKFYEGDRRQRVPDRVVLVTAGGLKVAHPADDDTVDRLRRVFNLYKEVKKPDGSTEVVALDLPEDLSLPSHVVHGQGDPHPDHVYRRGYLREGGAAEANKRAARSRANLPK